MTTKSTMRLIAAGALLCSATLLTPASSRAASFLLSDVTTWVGPESGPGLQQAVMVIQWPGQPAWAWGFRWDASQTRTGRDHLVELAGVDNRFSFSGSGFISNLHWDADRDGTADWSFPGFNGETGQYLNYFVNNLQQAGNFNDGAAPSGAHVLPPLGSPFDEDGPGTWVSSNTGVLGRPVVDGSWDGWLYSDGTAVPSLPVNAPVPVPEAGTGLLLLLLSGSALLRRRRI